MAAVQFLFQCEINPGERAEALQEFWTSRQLGAKARTFATQLIEGVDQHRPELDATLQGVAENWDLHRMGGVERNVMRLALYEMLHCPDIPPAVSINEAIDLAKELSSDESGRFVNGVLDRARKNLAGASSAKG